MFALRVWASLCFTRLRAQGKGMVGTVSHSVLVPTSRSPAGFVAYLQRVDVGGRLIPHGTSQTHNPVRGKHYDPPGFAQASLPSTQEQSCGCGRHACARDLRRSLFAFPLAPLRGFLAGWVNPFGSPGRPPPQPPHGCCDFTIATASPTTTPGGGRIDDFLNSLRAR